MPAKSEKQKTAARIALAVKKGEAKAKPGSPSAEMAKGMSKKQLKHYTEGLPRVMFGKGFLKG